MSSALAGCVLLATLLIPTRVSAQQGPHGLRFDLAESLAVDVPIVLGHLALLLLFEPPGDCRMCAPNRTDLSITTGLDGGRGIDAYAAVSDAGLWTAPLGAGTVALIAGATEHDRSGGRRALENLHLVVESVLATTLINSISKLVVARQRPDAHLARRSASAGDNVSFYSGHASVTASSAAALGMLAALRGYRWAPAAVAAGAGVSLATGLLRVVALRHWMTDVFTGWLLGGTLGALLPLLLHPRRGGREVADPAAATVMPLIQGGF